mgnify:CR=1 FL=1
MEFTFDVWVLSGGFLSRIYNCKNVFWNHLFDMRHVFGVKSDFDKSDT